MTAEGQRPQATWIDIVATGRAKAAIRRSLREEDKKRFVKLGRELARVAFEHVGKRATDKALTTAAKQLGYRSSNELLAQLGASEITARSIVQAVYPELAEKKGDEIDAARAVVGLSGEQSFTRAPCCRPIPGERIVGITYRGQGMVIHAIDCPELEAYEDQPKRWRDLRWHSGTHQPVYDVGVEMTISNDAGVLGRICTQIGEQKANITNLRFLDRKPDFYRLIVDLELRDTEHLHMVMLALEADSDVAAIERHREPQRKE